MSSQLITALLVSFWCFVAAQNQCPTKNGVTESCVEISQCDTMSKVMEQPTPANQAIIRQAFCGFSGNTPKVCCPTSKCITPNGALGNCVHPDLCAHIVSLVQNKSPIPESTRQLIQSLRCEGSGKFNVCCSPPQPKVPRTTSSEKCALAAIPPEPSTTCCGRESGSGGNRIFGGKATAVDEYPWLTIIEYVKNDNVLLLCGGTLISGRYVLTAAHCVAGDILTKGRPSNVRLGEYNTTNDGPDCVLVEGGGTDCTDGAVTVPIELTIPHPEYRSYSVQQQNDIALIKLDRVVEYTDFIRPICLPSIDITKAPEADLQLYTAGWGAVNKSKDWSDVKLAVTLSYVSNQDCEPSYTKYDRRMLLWDGQLCAGGDNKDSCNGDSGGPLLRSNGRNMEIVGIVSVGVSPCGMFQVPGIYTNVYKYLPWIRSQIRE